VGQAAPRARRSSLGPIWLSLCLFAFATTAATARGADAPADPSRSRFLDATDLGKSKDPIVVTSDRLEYDYRGNVVVYKGAVQATQGRLKITSDTLTVTFADGKGDGRGEGRSGGAAAEGGIALGGGSARLKEIVAAGKVRIEDGTRWATGGRAVLDQTNRTLVLSEAPVLHDGANEVLGDRVIVYLDEDRSVVEGGRKRVKAVLYPDREDKAAEDPQKKKAAAAGGRTTAEVAR
jgi:lipopolysaccharide export system protein LptA